MMRSIVSLPFTIILNILFTLVLSSVPLFGEETEKPAKIEKLTSEPSKPNNDATNHQETNGIGIVYEIGYADIDESEAEWEAGVSAAIGITYNFYTAPQKNHGFGVGVYYKPNDVTARQNQVDYRGIIETYLISGKYDYFTPDYSYKVSAGFAYSDISLRPTTSPLAQKDPLEGAFMFIIDLGFDYGLSENLKAGPNLALGIGDLTYSNFSVNITFQM